MYKAQYSAMWTVWQNGDKRALVRDNLAWLRRLEIAPVTDGRRRVFLAYMINDNDEICASC